MFFFIWFSPCFTPPPLVYNNISKNDSSTIEYIVYIVYKVSVCVCDISYVQLYME